MFKDNQDFYPTPRKLIDKMLGKIDFKTINNVLEPSAGKGDLVDTVSDKFKYSRCSYNRDIKWDIDTVEIDQNLQYILQGKGYRLIHNDFLTLETYKYYDLIAMNPPFRNGELHLLKAIDMQEKGGQIVCILNAETLKNPYSNSRKDLIQKLDKYNADIEYIKNAFIDAERQTYVEVALIYINIPKSEHNSVILDELRQEEQHRVKTDYNSSNVINADFVNGIIDQYNFEIKAGLKLIAEYNSLKPYMLKSLNDNCNDTILKLTLKDDDNCSIENSYIKQTREKYWQALFSSDKFMGLFTSNLKWKYMEKIHELKDYDFSLFNINAIKRQLNNEMIKGVEDTILALFDEFSHKHYWDKSASSNIHYYNGWATNKAWKINNKVIIPLQGFRDMEYSWGRYEPTYYKIIEKLADIEKVFNYLDNGQTEDIDILDTLKMAEHYGDTKKIQLKYFMITFYKKGTSHIEFTNEELLHKFNVFGSQRKGWLPPSYGKTTYKHMTQEEKAVVNEFEGVDSYNKVMANRDYYIVETSKLLMLPA